MRGHETILAIGARGHVVSDWNFIDLHIGGCQRSVVWKLAIREVAKQSWSLEPEDTWRAIGISLTEGSKEGGALTSKVLKCEIAT
jgi:hypothetical protein